MTDIAMLFGLVLMITALVLMYKCARGKSCRRRLEELADSVASDKRQMDFLVKRLDGILDDMAAENEKSSVLKHHTARLEELVEELDYKRRELEASNRSMADINGELARSNAGLVEKATRLRDEIGQNELAIRESEEYIDSLQRTKEGLDIAVNNMPAEEVHYLSRSLYDMGITPTVRAKIEAHGIVYIGEMVRLSEEFLMDIWGVGPVNLERIKARLSEHGVWFGMDVIRVGDRWYRRKQEQTNSVIHGREQGVTGIL